MTKNNENKNYISNKIIIILDDVNDDIISDLKNEEEHKTDDLSNINENAIEIDEEKESINNNIINNDLENCFNFYGGEKLIRPILIW